VKQLREQVRGLGKEYNKTEDDLKALQSVGQIIGDVLKQLDDERFIVKVNKAPSLPPSLPPSLLTPATE